MLAQVGSRICLSASEYHPETWQPSWTVTSLVTALVAHMTEPAVEIGSVQGATRTQKRKAAARSRSFECAACGCRHESFPLDVFPRPKGLENASTDRLPTGKGAGGRRGEGGGARTQGQRGRGPDEKGVTGEGGTGAGGLAGRSRLSWTVRVMASKPFLLALVLIIASVFLNKPL